MNATPLIAVHGWMADSRLFAPLDCAALDCRGYGSRRDDAGPFDIATIAADVLALADQNGWPRFHIAGHSMGGMVAQRLMVIAPRRLASAVLVAPVPASGARVDAARRQLLRRAIADVGARRELIDVNTGRRRDARWLDGLLELSLASTTAHALEAYMHAWIETDFAVEAVGSRVPVRVICGDLDPGCTPAHMRETVLAWYPDATLTVMQGVGHYPMREDAAAFARVVATCTAGLR